MKTLKTLFLNESDMRIIQYEGGLFGGVVFFYPHPPSPTILITKNFRFVFDFALVLAMVVDTWALLVIMAALEAWLKCHSHILSLCIQCVEVCISMIL